MAKPNVTPINAQGTNKPTSMPVSLVEMRVDEARNTMFDTTCMLQTLAARLNTADELDGEETHTVWRNVSLAVKQLDALACELEMIYHSPAATPKELDALQDQERIARLSKAAS